MKFRNMIAGAAIAALLCAPTLRPDTASAQGWEHGTMGDMHGEGMHFLMLLHSANLSPGQKAQIRQIIEANAGATHALRRQIEAIHQQLAGKLLAPGQVNAAALKSLIQQQSSLQEQLEDSMVGTALSIRSVLTPQQLAKVAQVQQQLQQIHSQLQTLLGPEAGAMEAPN